MRDTARPSCLLSIVRLIGVLIVPILFSTASVAQVRTWVSSQGLDSNACTRTEPCRNFAAAIAAVAADGEVVALDSAGYGPVSVTRGVTLLAPRGVHAAIAPTSGIAINIEAADATVTIRNLYLNSQGANYGVYVVNAGKVFVEASVVNGFSNDGILSRGGLLFVTDTMVRGSDIGIRNSGESAVVLERVHLDRNATGALTSSTMSIRDSVASHGEFGFRNFIGSSRMWIESSAAVGNLTGFRTTSIMLVSRCAAVGNTNYGMEASFDTGKLYVSECTITGNGTGIVATDLGKTWSRQNNTLRENGTDGTFTNTFGSN